MYYVILLPLTVQEPECKWKGFLSELCLYNKEGRKIQGSNLRYPLLVIWKKKECFCTFLPEEVLSSCKRLYQMHQSWWKTYKLRESLTESKILLLFSMSLIIHFVHKYRDIGKMPCLRKLIEVWFTALLLPAIPLASCFDFSGTSSFLSSYLAEDLVGSETSLWDPSTVFKNHNVILGSCACIQQW